MGVNNRERRKAKKKNREQRSRADRPSAVPRQVSPAMP
jgi:hypothetical protein